jgi:Flp pilus assembly protein TadD
MRIDALASASGRRPLYIVVRRPTRLTDISAGPVPNRVVVRVDMVDESQSMMSERAVALHKAGKIAEAAALYQSLLRTDPANPNLWGLLSVAQLQLDRADDAATSWHKCLSLDSPVPDKLRNIANFLGAMQLRTKGEAFPFDFLDGLEVPAWPSDLPLEEENKAVVLVLARRLGKFDREEAAGRLLESALQKLPDDPSLLAAAARSMIAAGKADELLALLEPLTSGAERGNGELLIAHAASAVAAGRFEDAKYISQRACEALSVVLSAKRPNQRFLVGVLTPPPNIINRVCSPRRLHFSSDFSATLYSHLSNDFRLVSVFPREAGKGALTGLLQPKLIVNNWVASEILSKAGELEFISDYADSLGLPVINHPRGASLTTRQRNAERLAGIPNLVVPRVLRIINSPETRELLSKTIDKELGFPVIIRSPFTQVGGRTFKVETEAELAPYLSTVEQPQLYAIEYVHNPVADGVYRKIRAAVIGSELLITNVRFASQWNVHLTKDAEERRKIMAFDDKGTASAFALEILRRPEATLGKPAMMALHEIRARTPLDYFGIDFDVLPDGRILFFEANASMYFGHREFEELPETIAAQKEAIRRLFENPPAPTSLAWGSHP